MREERSQHKNRAKAMKILRARIYAQQRSTPRRHPSADRKSQVGTGDRNERIRTYNSPRAGCPTTASISHSTRSTA